MDQKDQEFEEKGETLTEEDFEEEGGEFDQEEVDSSQQGSSNPLECIEMFTQKTINLLEESSSALQSFQQEWNEIKSNLENEYNQQEETSKKLHENYHFVKDSMNNFMSTMFCEGTQPDQQDESDDVF